MAVRLVWELRIPTPLPGVTIIDSQHIYEADALEAARKLGYIKAWPVTDGGYMLADQHDEHAWIRVYREPCR